VLIAEDETLIRLDLKGMLESAGLEVCAEARDGVEAVELADSAEPDLAVGEVTRSTRSPKRSPPARRSNARRASSWRTRG
jgi:AmiR/NasT family two-component response regulator